MKTTIYEKKKKNIILLSIFSFIALVAICGAITMFIFSFNITSTMKGYIEIEAEIIDMIEYEPSNAAGGDRSRYTYAPVYQYEIDSTIYVFKSNIASSNPAEKIGDNVKIFVNPNDPNDVLAKSGSVFYLLLAIFCTILFFFLLVFIIVLNLNDEGVMQFIILSSISFIIGFMIIAVPAITSGYNTLYEMLTDTLLMTIIGGCFIVLSFIFSTFLIIGSALEFAKKRREHKEMVRGTVVLAQKNENSIIEKCQEKREKI